MISRAILAIFLWCAATFAHAQSYSWPADLTGSSFNCSLVAAGEYNCPSMSFSKDTYIVITSPLLVHINGNFSAAKNFIIPQGKPLLLDVKGTVTFSKDMNAYMSIQSTGSMTFAKNTIINGDLNSGDNITINKDSAIFGDVFTKNTLKVGKNSSISGDCSYTNTNYYCHKVTPPGTVDHFLIEHDGTGLTCAPADVTVWACAAASSGGSCPTTSVGASGTLVVTNAATQASIGSYPFTIAAGQTNTTILVPYAGTKTVRFGTTASGTTCWDGDAASCDFTYNDSGFDFNIPDHVSATSQSIDIYAVSKPPGADTCAPAFTGTKPVTFTCSFVDPSSSPPGSARPVILQSGGNAIYLACGGGAQTINIAFDSAGKGQFSLSYADVGKVQLAASYPSASMLGSASFTAYPKKFAVTWPSPPTTPVAAGDNFNVRVTALNDAGNATPNYGRESTPQTAVLSFTKCKPADGEPGLFTGTLAAFSAGVADSSNSKWDEVGTGDVTATNTGYLATGQAVIGSSNTAASGCTGAFGRFRPHHFTTELEPATSWVYSGQPFGVKVTAWNASGTRTQNYYVKDTDIFARDVTFSAWSDAVPGTANPGPGAMTVSAMPAAAFTLAGDGAATGGPAYTFSTPLTKPTTIVVRAKDTDGTTSAGYAEAKLEIRSGRLRLSNAFGSRNSYLDVPVRVEYYTGNSWLLNLLDSTTVLPPSAFALKPPALMTGVTVSVGATIEAGRGTFRLTKPSNAPSDKNGSGSIDIAANLGATAADTSCVLAPHPASVGANLPWLRSLNGSCNTSWAQDPAARATFGGTNPEKRSTIFGREVFN